MEIHYNWSEEVALCLFAIRCHPTKENFQTTYWHFKCSSKLCLDRINSCYGGLLWKPSGSWLDVYFKAIVVPLISQEMNLAFVNHFKLLYLLYYVILHKHPPPPRRGRSFLLFLFIYALCSFLTTFFRYIYIYIS